MQIINKDEYHLKKEEIISKIKHGAVFIYPTDTIYGIGASALNYDAVKKVRTIKDRYERPFSVIAPSVEWIRENCEVNEKAEEWLEKLPGPYTLILKLKNKGVIDPIVNSELDTLGVRIPKHWSADIAKDANQPIITTSVNITGKEFMTSLDNLDLEVRNKVDFILYEGEIKGKPSTLVDLSKEEPEIKHR